MNNPAAKADSTKNKIKKLVAIQHKIMVGQTIGANIIVKSGINAGDKIVTDGVQTLHDGSQITTANKMGPGGGGKGGK
jgi:hypothetical protein